MAPLFFLSRLGPNLSFRLLPGAEVWPFRSPYRNVSTALRQSSCQRRENSSVQEVSAHCFLSLSLWRIKGVCVFFLLCLEVGISDGEERKREAAHDNSPLQYEELVKKQKKGPEYRRHSRGVDGGTRR